MPKRFETFRPRRPRKARFGPSFSQKYGKQWPALRLKILTRDNWQCRLCGRLCQDAGEAQVDHRVRKGLGGDDSETNLWTLCIRCHGKKSRSEQMCQ